MPRFRKAAIIALIAVPVVVGGGFVIQERSAQNGERLFGQVMQLISERFVDSVSAGALYEKAARGLVAELKDPYAELYSPKQLADFNQSTGGFYAGVGMQIEQQDGLTTVSKVFPHTPADEAGILTGDKIIGVDTSVIRNWSNEQVSSRLKGAPGTKVTAKFQRPGAPEAFSVSFTRRVIHIPAVPYAIMLDNKTAYVPVQGFNETAAEEVATNLQRLVNEGAKSVVLDLRGNGGGYLDQALAMTNIFLGKGKVIVTVRGRGEPDVVDMTQATALVPALPMVILTDGYTASASEVVTGALQDHDRALVVGMTSFGKGLVQGMYGLDGGYAMKLTTSKWYTPSGRSIQKERKLTDDGQLVEVRPDSLETDSARKARPKFKSDMGRIVYGGGAITPDVYITYDTISTAEQKLARIFVAKGNEAHLALYDLAFEMKGKITPDFKLTKEMRDDLFARLNKRGVTVDRKDYDAGITYVDRLLDGNISSVVFGDSTAKRRDVFDDRQLVKAIDLLKKGQNTKDLLALGAANPLEAAAPHRPKQ